MKKTAKYFYGNRISDYGMEHGYVDYLTLAKSFDCVLNNNIMENTYEIGYWEQESGMVDNSEEVEELQEQLEELEEKFDELENEIEELLDEYEPFDDGEHIGIKAKIHAKEKEKTELQNKIVELEVEIRELENQEEEREVFQWYIVSDGGAEILKDMNEIVYYNEELDMYLWGVTHFGTGWDYVLTNIKIDW